MALMKDLISEKTRQELEGVASQDDPVTPAEPKLALVSRAPAFKFPKPVPPPVIPRVEGLTNRKEILASLQAAKDFKEKLGPQCLDLVRQLREIEEDEIKDPDLAVFRQQDKVTVQESIKTMLSWDKDGYGVYKAMGILALASGLIKTSPANWPGVEETIKKLEEFQFLRKTQKLEHDFSLSLGHGERQRFYMVTKFDFNREDLKKVFNSLLDLIDRSKKNAKIDFLEFERQLKAKVGNLAITSGQLLDGRAGRIFMKVPDDKYPGGSFVVESDGKVVKLVRAVGKFSRFVNEELAGVRVLVKSLSEERVFLKNADYNLRRRVQIFHRILRAGIANAQKFEEKMATSEQQQLAVEKKHEELSAQASLTTVEFFTTEKSGSVFLDPMGRRPFYLKDGGKETEYSNVFFLAQRDKEGKIKIIGHGDNLENFFSGLYKSKDPGKDFQGLGYPFSILFRFAKRQAEEQTELEAAMVSQPEAAPVDDSESSGPESPAPELVPKKRKARAKKTEAVET